MRLNRNQYCNSTVKNEKFEQQLRETTRELTESVMSYFNDIKAQTLELKRKGRVEPRTDVVSP